MNKFNKLADFDIHSALSMVTDMWNTLDSAINGYMFLPELNICAALIHVLSAYGHRKRRIPIDMNMLQDCATFISNTLQSAELPEIIRYNFTVIQKSLYMCCGYSKVKFNGCSTDS